MNHNGLNMELVKKNNRASILTYINEKGQVSRKDIAEETELTPAAITMICTPLIQEGFLVETGTVNDTPGVGRKRVNLSLNYDKDIVLCINIGTEDTVLTTCNLHGSIRQCQSLKTNKEVSASVFLNQIVQIINNSFDINHVSAISVVVPGIVDHDKGISLHAYGLWSEEVNIRSILGCQINKPVIVENNVKAFALAELLYGTGRRHESFMTIKWGPGVGSAIVLDNKVYSGREGKAGEIGHFIVDPEGKKCTCGRRGCLETKVSYYALRENHDFKMEEFGDVYAKALYEGTSGDFDKALKIFSVAITNAMSIIEPRRVILYGKMFSKQNIVDKLIASCSVLDSQYNDNTIKRTELFDKEDYIGAVAVFLNKRIYGEI